MNKEVVFMTIKDASTATGLSQYFIRTGCKEGRIPHIRCGTKIMVDIKEFEEQLHGESRKQAGIDCQ